VHQALTAFTMYSHNFCWPVRTLREKGAAGQRRQRTPAMAAGLADHVWSLHEWLTLPAVQRGGDTTRFWPPVQVSQFFCASKNPCPHFSGKSDYKG
jgi:hypothetical protein